MMKVLCLALATLSLLCLNACSTVDGRGGMGLRDAPAGSAEQAVPQAHKTPWDYHRYPFGQ